MGQQAPAAPELVWETTEFVAPESVVFDQERKQFYVSNLGTWGQGAAPGDGFISRVSAAGRILDLRWVTGLDNPKGLALTGGRLYVGDDAELVEIDPAAAAISARHRPADGPGAFNDCTADPAGNVYGFSRRFSTVFRLRAGTFESWANVDATKTGWPNGLLAEPDHLLLGSWVVRGGYTVTDWTKGEVLHVSADGRPTPLVTLRQGAADHDYVIDQRLLVVPLVLDNAVRAYRWAPAD